MRVLGATHSARANERSWVVLRLWPAALRTVTMRPSDDLPNWKEVSSGIGGRWNEAHQTDELRIGLPGGDGHGKRAADPVHPEGREFVSLPAQPKPRDRGGTCLADTCTAHQR